MLLRSLSLPLSLLHSLRMAPEVILAMDEGQYDGKVNFRHTITFISKNAHAHAHVHVHVTGLCRNHVLSCNCLYKCCELYTVSTGLMLDYITTGYNDSCTGPPPLYGVDIFLIDPVYKINVPSPN